MVAPRVVDIATDFGAALIIDGNDITLQILFEEESVKLAAGICACAVFQPNGRTTFVIQINEQILRGTDFPLLCKNLRAVENILVLDTEGGFTRSDTIAVIGKRIGGIVVIRISVFIKATDFTEGVALKLSAFPRKQDIRAVGIGFANLNRIADCVILNAIDSAKERKLIAPRAVARWDSALEACACWGSQGDLLFRFPCFFVPAPPEGGT